jgi:inner membrane protein
VVAFFDSLFSSFPLLDNLTHTLTAAALSHAGLNRKTRFATLAVIAGANLPDVDVVSWAHGTATYLCYHRGLTHALIGVAVLGVLAGWAVHAVGRHKGRNKQGVASNLSWLVVCGLAGSASHLLLDFTNAYGVRPFLPFSSRWVAWDIMFIVDPVLLFVLLMSLGLPALLRLISEEVGGDKPAYRAGALLALAAMALLWVVRDASHRRAIALLDSVQFGSENPLRLGAFPSPANPLSWVGVAETDTAFYVVPVRVLDDHLNTDTARVFRKPESSPALEAAMRTSTGKVFLDFARFPWGQVETSEEGYEVTIRDLRFAMPGSDRPPGFVVRVRLGRDLSVKSEAFSFRSPRGQAKPEN